VATVARRRIAIDARSIARAALDMIEEGRLADLSMRKLAARIGVDPMTLYQHVTDKDDLVREMSDLVLDDVVAGMAGTAALPPRTRVTEVLVSFHEHLLRHPSRIDVFAQATITVNSAALLVTLTTLLMAEGLDEATAGAYVTTVTSYVLGSALQAQAGVEDVEVMQRPEFVGAVRERLPQVNADSVDRLLAAGTHLDFRRGLAAIDRGFGLAPAAPTTSRPAEGTL
jgi:AcrR family transcriptional regulator